MVVVKPPPADGAHGNEPPGGRAAGAHGPTPPAEVVGGPAGDRLQHLLGDVEVGVDVLDVVVVLELVDHPQDLTTSPSDGATVFWGTIVRSADA